MKKIITQIFIAIFIFSQIWTIATTSANNTCKIIESKKYDDIRDFKYSPDWKSFAFKARKDWKWILVKDGVESKKYDDIRDFKYSPDW